MIKVGIVEDLHDYRELLKVLISHSPEMELCFAAPSAEAAIKMIPAASPAICIVDIQLPGMQGTGLIRYLQQHHPAILCMVCTAYLEDDRVFEALSAGAHGYMLKSTSPEGILNAILELHAGGSPMSNEVARKVVTSFKQSPQKIIEVLTVRENTILEMLSQGLFYKEIALSLTISIDTVKRHCFNIYEKLHVQNRTEAINKVFRR